MSYIQLPVLVHHQSASKSPMIIDRVSITNTRYQHALSRKWGPDSLPDLFNDTISFMTKDVRDAQILVDTVIDAENNLTYCDYSSSNQSIIRVVDMWLEKFSNYDVMENTWPWYNAHACNVCHAMCHWDGCRRCEGRKLDLESLGRDCRCCLGGASLTLYPDGCADQIFIYRLDCTTYTFRASFPKLDQLSVFISKDSWASFAKSLRDWDETRSTRRPMAQLLYSRSKYAKSGRHLLLADLCFPEQLPPCPILWIQRDNNGSDSMANKYKFANWTIL